MRRALKLVSQGVSEYVMSEYVRPRLAAGGTMYSARPFVRSFANISNLWTRYFEISSNISNKVCQLKQRDLAFKSGFPHIHPYSDLGIYQIAAKMLWIQYLVGISRFDECRENWPATIREVLINLPTTTILRWQWKWKVVQNPYPGSPLQVNRFFGRLNHNTSFNEIGWLLLQ